jgi:hypothetical protein
VWRDLSGTTANSTMENLDDTLILETVASPSRTSSTRGCRPRVNRIERSAYRTLAAMIWPHDAVEVQAPLATGFGEDSPPPTRR